MRWSRRTSSSSVNIRILHLYSNVVQRVTDESTIILNMDKITYKFFFFVFFFFFFFFFFCTETFFVAAQVKTNHCIRAVRPTRLLSIHHFALVCSLTLFFARAKATTLRLFHSILTCLHPSFVRLHSKDFILCSNSLFLLPCKSLLCGSFQTYF